MNHEQIMKEAKKRLNHLKKAPMSIDRMNTDQLRGEVIRLAEKCDSLTGTLREAIRVIEYCAVDPTALSPMNNAQHVHASNSLYNLRQALKKKT